MGLLDWNDAEDDLFPNFDYTFKTKPPPKTSSAASTAARRASDPAAPSATLTAPAEQLHTLTSTASASSSRSSSSSSSPHRRHRASTSAAMAPPRPRPRRPSNAAFDLFGADAELQAAEPRIAFCDTCLCHCDVH